MPLLKVDNLAQHGVITDINPSQLPPNAWTSARNVRFRDGSPAKFNGHSVFVTPPTDWDGGTGNQVYYLLPVVSGANYYWVYCGLKDVRVWDGSTDSEITNSGGDYAGTASNNWTGGIIGGNPVLNNGVDEPQSWDKNTANPMTDLTGWTTSDYCSAMRVYKNYLVAMDVTKSGTRYRNMVKWSDAAAIDSLPGSWDETDATTDAGEVDLADSRGELNVGAVLDSLILRNTNIIYKDSETWTMDFIGGSSIFQFRKILETQGALSRRCMAEFKGNHFVLGGNDVFVTNGQTAESVISEKQKRFLFSDIDGDHYEKSFVFANHSETEMWVCYPEAGAPNGLPNKALVWNWRHNSWGSRDLVSSITTPLYGTPHIASGVADTSSAGDTWATADGNWDTWTDPWGKIGYNPQEQNPVIAANKLYKGDDTNQYDGTSMTSFIERTDIPVGEQDEFVRIKALYPRIEGSKPVDVTIGAQMAPGKAINWQSSVSFTPGTDQKVDARLTGTHAAVKFGSGDDQTWAVGGYDIEYDVVSRR